MHDTTSLTTLQKMAELGNANAQFTLGQKYEKGDGVPKNNQQAMKWYRKAAEQDDCDAQFSLARLYEEGSESIPQSYQQAITWYKKAAEQGDADAQLSLGRMYETGHEQFPANTTKAFNCYKDAAEQGNTEAMRRLARIYEKMGSAVNAYYWYERLYHGVPITKTFDEATAQHRLGGLYESGTVVEKDYAQAVHWYQKAAENNYFYSHLSLSKLYARGDGVTQDTQLAKEWLQKAINVAEDGSEFHHIGNAFKALQDYPNAVLCYQKAAENNHVYSRLTLSKLYATGDGVTQDTQLAKEWLHKAMDVTEAGKDSWFLNRIGGAFKALLDYPNAVLCYQKAAENNDVSSHFSLSNLYATGDGVTQDMQLAKEWLHKAMNVAKNGRELSEIGDAFKTLHDYPNAVLCYQKAAKNNHFDSYLTLSNLYATGDGVTQDTQLAKEWLHKAMNVAEDGWDFDRICDAFKALHDYHNAVLCYEKAAENNHFGSHLRLSNLYATGDGVTQDMQLAKEWLHKAMDVAEEHDFEQIGDAFKALHDYHNAVLCYEKAAENNHFGGHLSLSELYATGDGVTQDTQLAKEWLQKAINVAENGSEFNCIGNAFKALHDYPNAVLWYQKAAENNNFYSLFTLGELYARGDGVTQDTQLAKEWLQKAMGVAENGWNFYRIGDAFKALLDYPNAVLCYEKAAENNDFDSYLRLSNLYARGDGVTQDTQLAKEWLHKAMNVAKNGREFSEIGDAFEALHDYPNAVLWYQKAAENNNFYSLFTLGELYARGDGVTQDTQLAKEWLQKAMGVAENGWNFYRIGDAFKALHDYPNADLCYQKATADLLGFRFSISQKYATGDGVTQDTQLAKEWLHKAMGVAENGWDFDRIGDAFKALHDYHNAVLCYQKAAENNNFDSYLSLSELYARGDGVTQDMQLAKEWLHKAIDVAEDGWDFDRIGDAFKALQDYPNAVLWYQKAAENNDADAQFGLGELYENGQGVTQDEEQAVLWYQKAAERNHEAAQTALERIKARNTNANTPKTNRQKVSEYRKAAEQGDALAQFHLGQMYESGKGIPQNYVLAYAWLSVAVANEISEPTDHELAIQLRDEVGQKLPPHALSEAQQLAAQYFEQYVADE